MQKIKAGKKLYNYIDENNAVSSCAFDDDCHGKLFDFFKHTVWENYIKIIKSVLANKGEICPYDPKPPKSSGNIYKLSGMFALGFILFYLW
uniref:PIR Superfamily Protein n=1 Tax=Panagrolaimus davidi TaxID=227884 RepID=A0A914PS39_9BILA